VFRVGDRVIQRRNDYELGVFNGDIGRIIAADSRDVTCQVAFGAGAGGQTVTYAQGDLAQLALAYAITVHKSQGSEFDAVIVPLVAQHHRMLFRGLVYTALTRARRLAVFVGERRALALAVRNAEGSARQTALTHVLASLTVRPYASSCATAGWSTRS
jgi:exodeoxyribonuclease V alpha subunit